MKKNLFNVFLVCVFCVAAIPDMFAQQIKVTGKVTDSTNEGMPGVNVQVKGTATGTITDFDGNYSIDVPDSKSTLVFSFIGYVTQQVPVGGKKVLNVQLKDDTQTLDEVVVVFAPVLPPACVRMLTMLLKQLLLIICCKVRWRG